MHDAHPTDPESEIKRTIYGMDGIAPGFLRERRAWEDRFPSEEDEIGTSLHLCLYSLFDLLLKTASITSGMGKRVEFP